MNPLEFNNWAILMRPESPGDVFRLLHGLMCRFYSQTCCILCSNEDVANISILIAEPLKVDENDKWALWQTGNLYWLAFRSLQQMDNVERDPKFSVERDITEFIGVWRDAFSVSFACGVQHIWTSYSSARGKQKGKKNKIAEWSRICRVDCHSGCSRFPTYTANFSGVPLYDIEDSDEIRVAIVLRGNERDWRDSPSYHRSENYVKNELGRDFNLTWEFFGLDEEGNWPTWADSNPYSGKSLMTQLKSAQTFHLAIGINSSALDVFSIAGVPVLRECEFQGVMKNGWYFKKRYNSFLGGSLNLGLGIERKHVRSHNWQDRSRFLKYFHLLLKNRPWKLSPVWGNDTSRHLYIGPSYYFDTVENRVIEMCSFA